MKKKLVAIMVLIAISLTAIILNINEGDYWVLLPTLALTIAFGLVVKILLPSDYEY